MKRETMSLKQFRNRHHQPSESKPMMISQSHRR
jgi:hypothetical protein